MEKSNITQNYANIKNIEELKYHRRLLASKLEQQEIMVMYKLRCLWNFISPSNLFNMGCKAIATHNPVFNVFYKTFKYVKSLAKSRRKR